MVTGYTPLPFLPHLRFYLHAAVRLHTLSTHTFFILTHTYTRAVYYYALPVYT